MHPDCISFPVTVNGAHVGDAMLSPEDGDLLRWSWTLVGCAVDPAKRYLSRCVGRNGRHVYLHRIVLERALGAPLADGITADHINRNSFDCRRDNLRPATLSQNHANRGMAPSNRSGYRGVSRGKGGYGWRARIKVNQTEHNLGSFASREDAALAYNRAAREFFGEFAFQNDVGGGRAVARYQQGAAYTESRNYLAAILPCYERGA